MTAPKTKQVLKPNQIHTGITGDDIPLVEDLPGLTGGGSAINPNEAMFGTLLDYPFAGSGSAAGEIQYVRIFLLAGQTLTDMRTFLDSGGSPSRLIRMGVYDQTDPADFTLGPNARLAQTAATTTGPGLNGTFLTFPFLTGNLSIATSGFYWLALVQDSPVISYAVTATHRADFIPVRRETPGVTADLPAVAGPTTNPVSALAYLAGMVA